MGLREAANALGLPWIGHRLREARVHLDRLTQPRSLPRIAFSVGDEVEGFASGLRGYAIAKELRNLDWRTIVIPKQLELVQRQRLIQRERPDILVLQKSRHPLNRPKYYPETVCIFDIDDADFLYPFHQDSVIECMRDSARVVCGSRFIAEYAQQYNPAVDIIWTGSRSRTHSVGPKTNPPVVAWAVSSVNDYPHEFAFVMSALLMIKNKNWQFWLFGVNDISHADRLVEPLRQKNISVRTFPFLAYEKFLEVLEEASIGLAPLVPDKSKFSAGKSFGKVLHYLNCRMAVVASNVAEYPLFFQTGINGFLASNEREFAESTEILLADETLRQRIIERAYIDYLEKLSMNSVARQMDTVLRSMLGSNGFERRRHAVRR